MKTSIYELDTPPVRLCCGRRHFGPVCPDGLVRCCLCFNRFPKEKLHLLENGKREDVCQDCWDKEQKEGNQE